MNYKVLIVDDEPIILSGIKSLIDWQLNRCVVVGTARNGKEALSLIQKEHPHIVLCDINMPVMNGIELLQQAAALDPTIVFLMLTNLEDFSLVQTAMRYHAIDYILKSHLEPAVLEKALRLATKEADNRETLRITSFTEETQVYEQMQTLKKAMVQFFSETYESRLAQTKKLLQTHHADCNMGALYLAFDFSVLPDFSTFQQADKKRLFDWQLETVEQVAKNNWRDFIVLPLMQSSNHAIVFTWNNNAACWAEQTEVFFKKLTSVSLKITQVQVSLLATDCFATADDLPRCRKELSLLADYHYNTSVPYITFAALPPTVAAFAPVALQNVTDYFESKLQAKDFRGLHLLLDRTQQKMQNTHCSRQSCAWVCHELADVTYKGLLTFEKKEYATLFYDAMGSHTIEHFTTKEKSLAWLASLQHQLDAISASLNTGKTDILDKVCEYIQTNIGKRILLQDVAEHVALSPNYLSSIFKKQYGKSLVEYINEAKVAHAKRFIEEGNLRIYEISDALGFENAYYFAKVFKRYTGMSPSEYQHEWKSTPPV